MTRDEANNEHSGIDRPTSGLGRKQCKEDRQTDGRADKPTDKQADRQTKTNREANQQTGRQTDSRHPQTDDHRQTTTDRQTLATYIQTGAETDTSTIP